MGEYHRQYYLKHRKEMLKRRKEHDLKIKRQVIDYYGGKCACCGEKRLDFLAMDHINNDGAKHRKEMGNKGANLLIYLKKRDYPKGFQVLCFNCNFSKWINKGKCIHQIERENL